MTKKKWGFSNHALSRGASRIGLIIDAKAKSEIGRALDSSSVTVVTNEPRSNRVLYEISVFGIKVIVVCQVEKRVVVTFLDPKRWYRDKQTKLKSHRKGAPRGWNRDGEEE